MIAPEADVLVSLKKLSKVYRMGVQDVVAIGGIDLDIRQGEYVAIMGHSGSGKSTLLNILGCLDRPTGGRYMLGGEDVSVMNDDALSEIRNRRIGFIFQSFNLIHGLSIEENIEVPLFYQGVRRSVRRQRSTELARLVGLGGRLGHRPRELSGGQQQRVAIARALANEPLVLLADEPTGNLDTETGKKIEDILIALNRNRGITLIVVTHNPSLAGRMSQHIGLSDGRIYVSE